MATFGFTIPAATVNTIKDTTGSSDFEVVADRGLSNETTHRVLTARFGDGYEQRVLDGINTKNTTFNLSFNNRDAEEINLIAGFLDLKAGLNFNFTVKDTFLSGAVSTTTMKVVCETYNINYIQENFYSLTCTFRRVYEP